MVLSDVTREGRIIGRVGFIPSDENTYVLNQRVAKIETVDVYKLFFYLYFNSREFREHALSRADSATVLNLSNDHIYKHRIPFPYEEIVASFNEITQPMK
jgi:restriction endonuclease S subunit